MTIEWRRITQSASQSGIIISQGLRRKIFLGEINKGVVVGNSRQSRQKLFPQPVVFFPQLFASLKAGASCSNY